MRSRVFLCGVILAMLAVGCASTPTPPPRRLSAPPSRNQANSRETPRHPHIDPIPRLNCVVLPSELNAVGQKRPISWDDIERVVQHCSRVYRLRRSYLYAMMKVCSGFNLAYRSSAGAEGLMSLMPSTARALGVTDSYNAAQNIAGGALYLRRMLREFSDNGDLAFAAYHAGPGRVHQAGGVPFQETRDFVNAVCRYANLYERVAPWEAEKQEEQERQAVSPPKTVQVASASRSDSETAQHSTSSVSHSPAGVVEQNDTDIVATVRYYARRHGLDEALVLALIEMESGFNPRAVSPCGAQGLMQLMPETARRLGVTDPYHPVQNIAGGTLYLAQMFHEFNQDARLALAAYNAGPEAVRRYGGVPPFEETRVFVKNVLTSRGQYTGGR